MDIEISTVSSAQRYPVQNFIYADTGSDDCSKPVKAFFPIRANISVD